MKERVCAKKQPLRLVLDLNIVIITNEVYRSIHLFANRCPDKHERVVGEMKVWDVGRCNLNDPSATFFIV